MKARIFSAGAGLPGQLNVLQEQFERWLERALSHFVQMLPSFLDEPSRFFTAALAAQDRHEQHAHGRPIIAAIAGGGVYELLGGRELPGVNEQTHASANRPLRESRTRRDPCPGLVSRRGSPRAARRSPGGKRFRRLDPSSTSRAVPDLGMPLRSARP